MLWKGVSGHAAKTNHITKLCSSSQKYVCLLPSGSEEHEVLQTRSIHVIILPSCQSFTIVHFKCLNCEFIWVVQIRNTSEAVLRPQYAPCTLY